MPDVQGDGTEVSEDTFERRCANEVERRADEVARYDEGRYKSALEELAFYRIALASIILEHPERRVAYTDLTRYTEQATRGTIEHVYDQASRRHVLYLKSRGERIEVRDVEHSGEKG